MEYEQNKIKQFFYIENNREYLFIPIINKKNDTHLTISSDLHYNDLPNKVYGKYLHNQEGYNPSGWWRYIEVKKNELIYK